MGEKEISRYVDDFLEKFLKKVENLITYVGNSFLVGAYMGLMNPQIKNEMEDLTKEFSYPYLKDLTSRLRKLNGIKPDLHICGHTKRQWEDLKDFDIEFFSVDNCHDLEECKIAIENKLALLGNLPPVDVMKNGSIDDVIEAVKTCIKKAADAKSGYIAATGCGSPVGTPIENLDAFIYAINKYGKNAKIGQMQEAIKS